MPFVKMHGLGNDFVILDHLDGGETPGEPLLRLLADRRFGIGCDQVVRLVASSTPECCARMEIYNPDASQAEMCGNAARCVALYLQEKRGFTSLAVETLAGIIRPHILPDGRVAVDMGEPRLEGREIPTVWSGPVVGHTLQAGEEEFSITAVSMGNPHCVIFHPQVEQVALAACGPLLSEHPAFPRRTNVEFVQVVNPQRLRMRVWERGAGITPACGTGACASAVAAVVNGLCQRQVVVQLDGGELEIHWREDNRVIMIGPASWVFAGTFWWQQ
ncbi:MAG: diaminopimelate epimerase [Magnetococcales bacterium]|nr:diaminopimelate epimerase [Magnetococcales bacterium]NGZ26366.1 diaminopimelate epimerase [Magnetococcales bacterium]